MTEKGFRTKQRIPNTLRLFETKQQALQAQKKIIEKAIEFLQKKTRKCKRRNNKGRVSGRHFPKGRGKSDLLRFNKIVRGKAWTRGEDQTLIRMWKEFAIHAIYKAIPGRTIYAIRHRVQELGLPNGPPQGYIAVKAAAEKLGISHHTLTNLCEREGISFFEAYPSNAKNSFKRKVKYVEWDAVLEAYEQRLAEFSLKDIARELSVPHDTLWHFLKRRNMTKNPTAGALLRYSEEEAEKIRRAFREYESQRKSHHPLAEVARDLKMSRGTLATWMVKRGMPVTADGISDQERETVMKAYEAYRSRIKTSDLAKELSMSSRSLLSFMKEHNLESPEYNSINEELAEKIRKRHAEVRIVSIASVARELGVPVLRVSRWIRRNGLGPVGKRGVSSDLAEKIRLEYKGS